MTGWFTTPTHYYLTFMDALKAVADREDGGMFAIGHAAEGYYLARIRA